MWVSVGLGGVNGIDWLWIGLGVLADIATYAGGGWRNKDQINRIPAGTRRAKPGDMNRNLTAVATSATAVGRSRERSQPSAFSITKRHHWVYFLRADLSRRACRPQRWFFGLVCASDIHSLDKKSGRFDEGEQPWRIAFWDN